MPLPRLPGLVLLLPGGKRGVKTSLETSGQGQCQLLRRAFPSDCARPLEVTEQERGQSRAWRPPGINLPVSLSPVATSGFHLACAWELQS